jgi:hypothetical protein
MEMLALNPYIMNTEPQPCKDVETAKTTRDAMQAESWAGLSEEEKKTADLHKLIVVNGKRNR